MEWMYLLAERKGMNYSEYLQSERWQATRRRMMASKKVYRCYVCRSTERLDLHHKTYKRIGRERLADLVWLCRACHQEAHARLKRQPRHSKAALHCIAKRMRKERKD